MCLTTGGSSASGNSTAQAAAGCIIVLPINVKVAERGELKDPGAILPLVVSTKGPRLRRVRIGLYSYRGQELGKRRVAAIQGEKIVGVRLKANLPSGDWTIYAEGFPNANPSCGPKHSSKIVKRLRTRKKTKQKEEDTGGEEDTGDAPSGGCPAGQTCGEL
ncbi:MAG: hypothetical protein H0V29_07210 [Thermoleophilaceae bacterium]|nr:hypothetical protein [Thermoleophilaceae bacterium]